MTAGDVELDDLGPSWSAMSPAQRAAYGDANRDARTRTGAGPPPAPEPFATVDLDAPAVDPPQMHVERLLLDRDLNLFAGPKGSGKTPTLLSVAVSVATGAKCFGTLAVRRTGPVVVVTPEDGQAATIVALKAILTGLGLSEEFRREIHHRIHVVADDERVDLARHVGRLRATVEHHGAALVVLDPMRNLLPGADENDANVAGPVADELRRQVCRDAGATVALSMHRRKLSRERGADPDLGLDDVRGSSAWVAACRVVYGVAQTPDSRLVELRCLAANRFRPADAHHTLRLNITTAAGDPTAWTSCSLVDVDDGLSATLTPGVGAGRRPLKENERVALKALDDEPDTALTASGWARRTGLPERTFYDIKTRLVNARLASSVASGKRAPTGAKQYVYSITPEGKNALLGGPVSVEE